MLRGILMASLSLVTSSQYWTYALFVNSSNTLFTASQGSGSIVIWSNANTNRTTTTILANLSSPWSLFVTGDGQIFVADGSSNNRVDRWTSTGTRLSLPVSFCSACYGLFVDLLNNLYCSQSLRHQVIKASLESPSNELSIVAGTANAGSAANMLWNPRGLFVTIDLDLYVADCGNDGVQLFRSGEIKRTNSGG